MTYSNKPVLHVICVEQLQHEVGAKLDEYSADKVRKIIQSLPQAETSVSNLGFVRNMRGMTQQELAKKSGVTSHSVWMIENGYSKGRPSTMKKLADALQCDVGFIMR